MGNGRSQASPKKLSSRQRRRRRERQFLLVAVVLVILAWGYGYFTGGTEAAPLVDDVIPGAVQMRREGEIFVAENENGEVVGYAALGSAPGYGGPIEMLVGVAPDGAILNVRVVTERESPGFFRLVRGSDLIAAYSGRQVSAPLTLGQDLDAVSGATVSAEGVAASVRDASRRIADEALQVSGPPEQTSIEFGWPEITLLLLFASGYFAHKWRNPVWKKRARWGTLIAGLIFLGFVFTAPLTITMIISLLSGYWPDWHNNLYWYLLIGGILFVTTVDAKNPYCSWFCPFGAFQECIAAVSQAKLYRPRRWKEPLQWVQRGLALTAVLMGLALRRPGVASYEPFAALFDLRGTTVQWIFLVLVALASLVMYRPFCTYLCPLDPVVDFIAATRRWLKEGWTTWRKKQTAQA
jgi:hypothetical protein